MLFRIVSGIAIGLVIAAACSKKSDDDNDNGQPAGSSKPHDKSGYTLLITSDDEIRIDGKGNVTVQLVKDGKAVTDAKDKKVTLTIVCGDNPAVELEGMLGEDGKTDIGVDLSNKDWSVDDYGTCKLSVVTSVDEETVETKDVELSTTGGKTTDNSEQCQENCDQSNPSHTFKIGEEIGTDASLTSGTLSLHDCTNAVLYTVVDGSIRSTTNNSVMVSNTGYPTMFVLGTAGSKCVLQHKDTGNTVNWATIADTNVETKENKAANIAGFEMFEKDSKLQVTLPPNNSNDTVALYVSKDGGITWGSNEIDETNTWDSEFSTSVTFDDDKPLSHEVLLRVAPTSNKVWWGHYTQHEHVNVPAVTVGKVFKITGLAHNNSASLNFAVKVKKNCGLHFFHINSVNTVVKRVSTTVASISDEDKGKFSLLAVDGGTATYESGCVVELNIASYDFAAKSTAMVAVRPAVTGIKVKRNSNSIQTILPIWNTESWGAQSNLKLYSSTSGGNAWVEIIKVTWDSKRIPFPLLNPAWHKTASNNQSLISVDVASNKWWYYVEGS